METSPAKTAPLTPGVDDMYSVSCDQSSEVPIDPGNLKRCKLVAQPFADRGFQKVEKEGTKNCCTSRIEGEAKIISSSRSTNGMTIMLIVVSMIGGPFQLLIRFSHQSICPRCKSLLTRIIILEGDVDVCPPSAMSNESKAFSTCHLKGFKFPSLRQ